MCEFDTWLKGMIAMQPFLRVTISTQAVAAGVRPQLGRIGPDASDPAVRKVVLSVAQQQKLAACSALLREVAASYGFALHLAPDVGDEDLGAPLPAFAKLVTLISAVHVTSALFAKMTQRGYITCMKQLRRGHHGRPAYSDTLHIGCCAPMCPF